MFNAHNAMHAGVCSFNRFILQCFAKVVAVVLRWLLGSLYFVAFVVFHFVSASLFWLVVASGICIGKVIDVICSLTVSISIDTLQ